MLQLSSYFVGKPVLSLRVGGPVAWVQAPIINPKNLKIEGFYCVDSMDKTTLVLVTQDIRELNKQGFIVDDHDVLVEPDDLVRMQEVMNFQFELYKKPVETVDKVKIGKVNDYAVESSSMYVQKLYVSQPIWRNFAGGSLSVDRSQVVEVTNKRIIINELLQPTPSTAPAVAA
jgi:sporulation protein YlmC with PRC-barrel domain